ncbi:MAG: PAS domain S-box protein [Fibrobacter sp.]|jgi:PAS domain S-box-containing protein|nr:PAS domain S-box protein [Fibrobacter sp.]
MSAGETGTSTISVELFESLQRAFNDFQLRAEQLSSAYARMQEDFRKINIELDRKNSELEQSLAKQEEMRTYLNSILESMDNGVVGVDDLGRITNFNRAASEITGFDQSEVFDKPYIDLFKGGTEGEPAIYQVLHTGRGLKRDEKVIWHKDGHPVPVSYQTELLKDKNGRRLGAVEIFSDISRIKALEKEMQQAKTMAALGEMSATVAHEIRNPLGAMGMWAGLLERDLSAEDPRRKTLGKIIEGLSRLNKIVSNLLVYTRPIKAEFRKVQLDTILEEIVDFVQIEIERLGRKIDLKKNWEKEPVYVLADPEKIGQVVMNICLNSVQAISEGGQITVSMEMGERKNAGYVCFSVSDSGCGIEKEKISKIFDPFFTTKENGTGLGLAIVKRFVESHSGFIDVKSAPGKGTAVKVFLPLLKE